MPDLSAYASVFRGRHRYTGWLSVPEEAIVFSRAVNMASITYPLTAITFDNPYSGAGAYTDVEEGAEIRVFDGNTSTEKGRLRVASGGATSTVIQVNEVSRNRISLADNDRFEVLRSWRVRDKLVAASATFDKDSRLAYVDQNELVPPRVVDGGHWAGFLQSGSAVVDFIDGSESADPDGGALSHAWTVSGGTLDNAAIADPEWTLSTAGTYWAKHAVTANGRTWTKRSVAVVHDADHPPIPCNLDSLSGALSEAWSVSFRVHARSGIDKLPNGAMLLYHENEVYGTTKASYGNRVPSRSRVKGVFYLIKHSIRIDWKSGDLLFEALNPRARLFKLPGFSQVLTAVADPSTWQEWKTPLSTNDLLLYLIRWHTTYTELFDVLLPDEDYAYPEFFVQQATPGAQLIEIADAVDALVTADRTGTLIIRQDLNLRGSTARGAATVTYDLTESDILDIEIEEAHEYQIAELIGRGFTTSGEPLQAKSGNAPAEGSDFTSADRLIVGAQSGTDRDLNERTGRRWQKANGLKNGLPVQRVRVTLRGAYDVFDPAYGEWVTLTLSRTVKGRQVSFSAARFSIESVNVRHEVATDEAGNEIRYKRVELSLTGETDGPAGVTYVEPQQGTNDVEIPDYTIDFPDISFTTPTGRGLRRGSQRLAKIMSDGTLAVTFDFDTPAASGGPAWAVYSLGIGSIQHAVGDPFTSERAYVLTSTGIYEVTSIFGGGGPSVALLHALPFTGMRGQIETERATDSPVIAVVHDDQGTHGVYACYSTNRGASWSDHQITTVNFTSGGFPNTSPVAVSARTGTIYTTVPTVGSPLLSHASHAKAASIGALTTWNDSSKFDTGKALSDHLHFPFGDTGDNTAWCNYTSDLVNLNNYRLYRYLSGSGADKSPVDGGRYFALKTNYPSHGIDTYAGDKRRVAFCGIGCLNTSDRFYHGFWVSTNEGDSWRSVIAPVLAGHDIPGNGYPGVKGPMGCDIAGDSGNTVFVYGTNGAIWLTNDFGASIDDRTGDHSTTAYVVRIIG